MAQKLYVTLDELRSISPCKERYHHLLSEIEWEDAEEIRIPFELILETNGPADTSWLLTVSYHMIRDLGLPPYSSRFRVDGMEVYGTPSHAELLPCECRCSGYIEAYTKHVARYLKGKKR